MYLIHSYSRKIIWLRVAPSNNQPGIVLRYYLESVEEICGNPFLLFNELSYDVIIIIMTLHKI